jgi:hypothetical protein
MEMEVFSIFVCHGRRPFQQVILDGTSRWESQDWLRCGMQHPPLSKKDEVLPYGILAIAP